MEHLGNEIRYVLKAHSLAVADVAYVEAHDADGNPRYVDVESFLAYADRVDYDSGYGGQNIDPYLEIVLKDGSWFDRREYDGSEWFEYHSPRNVDVEVEPFDPHTMVIASHYGGEITIDGVEQPKYYGEE